MKTLRLHPGKERSLLRGHPWIFESAIASGGGDSGETVRVVAHDGVFLAWAAYSPASKIRARVWSFQETQRIDAPFFLALVSSATRARELFDLQSNAVRLVHGESDGLPGLVVDRYDQTLVLQITSAGAQRWKSVLVDALCAATGVMRVYERSDTSSRTREGLAPACGWLRGGDAATPTALTLREHGWELGLDVALGHKTGFYLDQRDNRQRFFVYARRLGFARTLNCYCYTGGFTVAALAGLRAGGHGPGTVTSIDSSAPALQQARANLERNGLDGAHACWLDADVNASLRRLLQAGERFDAIVLDPPKLAPTVAHAERAARAYKDINRLALQLLAPSGVLFTFSCSGGISSDLFHKIVAGAGADAGVDAFILERLGAAPDHPMTLRFPEGEYLKGLVLQRR